ncbi:uncharacterized protein LOC143041520 [Oratosquilla oratoria]|uniref:uncharacterized protein LOC143041520 n=1 Tax=Oratosquilla oratoria TaxID=337810 RepID=UPI003F76D54A
MRTLILCLCILGMASICLGQRDLSQFTPGRPIQVGFPGVAAFGGVRPQTRPFQRPQVFPQRPQTVPAGPAILPPRRFGRSANIDQENPSIDPYA